MLGTCDHDFSPECNECTKFTEDNPDACDTCEYRNDNYSLCFACKTQACRECGKYEKGRKKHLARFFCAKCVEQKELKTCDKCKIIFPKDKVKNCKKCSTYFCFACLEKKNYLSKLGFCTQCSQSLTKRDKQFLKLNVAEGLYK